MNLTTATAAEIRELMGEATQEEARRMYRICDALGWKDSEQIGEREWLAACELAADDVTTNSGWVPVDCLVRGKGEKVQRELAKAADVILVADSDAAQVGQNCWFAKRFDRTVAKLDLAVRQAVGDYQREGGEVSALYY